MTDVNSIKYCSTCKQDKPVAEFYTRSNGNPLGICKTCHKARMRELPVHDRHEVVNKSEKLVIDRLSANHIPASPGKTLGYKWADIVAWGCVLIECKVSTDKGDGLFQWSFSPTQQQHGIRAHIIILCADYGYKITYHLFDAKDPVFTSNRDSRNRKTGITFIANPNHRKHYTSTLTNEVMNAHQDNWGLIERYRLQVSTNLDPDIFSSDWRVK